MSENILKLPVIPLRGLTVLPGTTVHFDISRKSSIKAAETAMLAGKNLFVVTQKNPVEETPGFDGIYNIGTVVVIKQLNKLPDNIVRDNGRMPNQKVRFWHLILKRAIFREKIRFT